MARYAAGTQTLAGSTTLPIFSLFSNGAALVQLFEVGIFNTTTTALDIGLYRYGWAAVGTVGSAVTTGCLDNPSLTARAQPFSTPSAGTATLTPLGYRAEIGAAIGAGVIWTFGGSGITIPAAAGTVNGIAIIPPIGTGQACDVYAIWEE